MDNTVRGGKNPGIYRWLSALFLLPTVLFFIAPGCGNKKSAEVLARVNRQKITLGDFERRTTYLQVIDGEAPSTEDVLDQLIERQLVLQRAREMNLDVDQKEIKQRLADFAGMKSLDEWCKEIEGAGLKWSDLSGEIKADILAEKVTEKEVNPGAKVSGEEIEAYFNEHKKELWHPEQVRASQIMVDKQEAAEEILKLLKAGADFSALAKEKSLSPDRDKGGDLGFFGPDEMPEEFVEATRSLKTGQISSVVKSAYGFHVFKVTGRRAQGAPSLEESGKEIEAILKNEKKKELYLKWLETLRSKAEIRISPEFLERKK